MRVQTIFDDYNQIQLRLLFVCNFQKILSYKLWYFQAPFLLEVGICSTKIYGNNQIVHIRMSHWLQQMVDGAEYLISCNWLTFLSVFSHLQRRYAYNWFKIQRHLKVSKSQKQIMASWILPKNKRNSLLLNTKNSELHLFFGRIEDTMFFFEIFCAQ